MNEVVPNTLKNEAMTEVFWPTNMRNKETNQFCAELAVGVATMLLAELENTKKATHQYLSATMGSCSLAVILKEEEMETLGLRANNDPSEGSFATLTDILVCGGRISLQSAAAIGQMRYNHDMSRDISSYVSGRDSKKQINIKRLGLFHSLHEDCVTALIAMAKKKSAVSRKCFQKSIDERRQRRQDKIKQGEMKEEEGARKSLIDVWFLHKQFFSPACWDTVDKATFLPTLQS